MPNKLVMLSTHGTWDPIVENPALLKKDGTSLTGSTKSVEEHRVNHTLFENFNTAIEKTYDEMQITTGDNIYIGYDGDGIQGWDHLNRTDVNTTIPVPPTILFLKFISHLVIKGIPVANIFLIQCQNDYISSFADLTKCIETEGNLKKMMFPELTEDKINKIVEVLERPKNINIIHTDEDIKNILTNKINAIRGNKEEEDKLNTKLNKGKLQGVFSNFTYSKAIYTEKLLQLLGTTIVIPVKQESGKYGGIYFDNTGEFYPVASTAGWQKFLNTPQDFFIPKGTILPSFNMIRYLPVWNDSVIPDLKKDEIKKSRKDIITLNIEDHKTVIHLNVKTIRGGIHLNVKGGSRKKTKRKPKRTKKLKPTKRKPSKRKPTKQKPSKRKPSKRSRVRKNKKSLKKMKGGVFCVDKDIHFDIKNIFTYPKYMTTHTIGSAFGSANTRIMRYCSKLYEKVTKPEPIFTSKYQLQSDDTYIKKYRNVDGSYSSDFNFYKITHINSPPLAIEKYIKDGVRIPYSYDVESLGRKGKENSKLLSYIAAKASRRSSPNYVEMLKAVEAKAAAAAKATAAEAAKATVQVDDSSDDDLDL